MLTWGTLPPSPTPTPSPGKVAPPHSAPKWDPIRGPYPLHLSHIGGPYRGPTFCVARMAGLSFGGMAVGVGIAGEIGVVGGTIPLSPPLSLPSFFVPRVRACISSRHVTTYAGQGEAQTCPPVHADGNCPRPWGIAVYRSTY